MPSNAAGPWRKFDAEDKATWPEKPGWYLIWVGTMMATTFWHGGGFIIGVPDFWVEILPPESRGE